MNGEQVSDIWMKEVRDGVTSVEWEIRYHRSEGGCVREGRLHDVRGRGTGALFTGLADAYRPVGRHDRDD